MFTTYFPETFSFANVVKKYFPSEKGVFLVCFLIFFVRVRLKIPTGQYIKQFNSDLFTLNSTPKPIKRAFKEI
jgi:hypothetical protein